MIYYVEVNF